MHYIHFNAADTVHVFVPCDEALGSVNNISYFGLGLVTRIAFSLFKVRYLKQEEVDNNFSIGYHQLHNIYFAY